MGKQKPKRTCEDGTDDKCTTANKSLEMDGITGTAKKDEHYSVEHMAKTCGGKNIFCGIISLITSLI